MASRTLKGSFIVEDGLGTGYTVNIFLDVCDGDEQKRYETSEGREVQRIAAGVYRFADTGETLTSDDAAAP